MSQKQPSPKRLALAKANTQTVIISAVSAFIIVFCIVAINYLLGLRSYQQKIIDADQLANNQLTIVNSNAQRLTSAYNSFVSKNPTIINKPVVSAPIRYNNATVILDALPSQYDFPAMITSIDKILQSDNLDVQSIGGTDQSTSTSSSPSTNPQPVAMPFNFTIQNANYASLQTLFLQLELSIRPIQIQSINLSGTDSSMTLSVNAQTYFQPGKVFKIGSETISQ